MTFSLGAAYSYNAAATPIVLPSGAVPVRDLQCYSSTGCAALQKYVQVAEVPGRSLGG